jgi:hypothetical protein
MPASTTLTGKPTTIHIMGSFHQTTEVFCDSVAFWFFMVRSFVLLRLTVMFNGDI